MQVRVVFGAAVDANQLVKRRQRPGDLRHGQRLGVYERPERGRVVGGRRI